MAKRALVYYPDPRLLRPLQKVENFNDPTLHTLIADMFETMVHEDGVGLAANQIGEPWRIATINITDTNAEPFVIINPEIISHSGKRRVPEGCLSVKHHHDTVDRADVVEVKFQDQQGQWHQMRGQGYLAHVFQHEIDHLNGKLYIHHLSPLKRQLFERKYRTHSKKNK